MKQKSERAKRRDLRAAADVGRAITLSKAVAEEISDKGGLKKLDGKQYVAAKNAMHRALRGLPPKAARK